MAVTQETLEAVYGADAPSAGRRLDVLVERWHELFGAGDPLCFSSPGRCEVIGNHTDHNGGKILAASITMDTVGAAAPTGNRLITIASEGYEPFTVDLDDLDTAKAAGGSAALVAGMAHYLQSQGFSVEGFNATASSEVVPAAGVSSSASFEMLVAQMVSTLFNDGAIPLAVRARAGQHAENAYWGKGSGLMDQMACAAGGAVLLDFSDGVSVRPAHLSFDDLGYELVIVNTGKPHADLSDVYSSVPAEMHAVASSLGVERLCEMSREALLAELPRLRAELGNDRALMRALHYFAECDRVDEAAAALEAGEPGRLLGLIADSGNSSWRWLQNVYVPGDEAEQSIPLALALTETYLQGIGDGACRIHGGGFAGVIMAVVPKDAVEDYAAFIGEYVGPENVYRTNVRQTGATCLG